MFVFQDAGHTARRRYQDKFLKLRFRGLIHKAWNKLGGSTTELLHLGAVESALGICARYDAGIRTVTINQIVGSESRTKDFDRQFRPLRGHINERWLGIAVAKELGESLPVIELVQVGTFYFVRDGHHRVSVARLFGQKEIEASIVIWEAEQAIEELFRIAPSHSPFQGIVARMRKQVERIQDLFNRPGGGLATGSGTPALSGL